MGILLAYITGSSFVYNETLRVTPGLFAVLFGVNAIGFIGASQLNPVLLRHQSLFTVTAVLLLALLLLAVVASGQASTLTLTALFLRLAPHWAARYRTSPRSRSSRCERAWAVLPHCKIPCSPSSVG